MSHSLCYKYKTAKLDHRPALILWYCHHRVMDDLADTQKAIFISNSFFHTPQLEDNANLFAVNNI